MLGNRSRYGHHRNASLNKASNFDKIPQDGNFSNLNGHTTG